MERQYVFFHTASGCMVMVVGIIILPYLSAMLSAALLDWLPSTTWVIFLITFIPCGLAVWLAFRADKWSLRRRKQSRGKTT